MAYLHRLRVCHGRLSPACILFQVRTVCNHLQTFLSSCAAAHEVSRLSPSHAISYPRCPAVHLFIWSLRCHGEMYLVLRRKDASSAANLLAATNEAGAA